MDFVCCFVMVALWFEKRNSITFEGYTNTKPNSALCEWNDNTLLKKKTMLFCGFPYKVEDAENRHFFPNFWKFI